MAKTNRLNEGDLSAMGLVWDENVKAFVKKKVEVSQAIIQKPSLEEVKGSFFGGMSHDEIVTKYNGGPSGLFLFYDVPTFKNNKQLFVRKKADGNYTPGSTDSKLVKEYKRVAYKQYESHRQTFLKMVGTKKFPLRVRFIFVRRSAQEFDYNNITQLVQDMMKEYHWLPDDSCKYLIPNFDEGYGIDKFNPGVIIKVL